MKAGRSSDQAIRVYRFNRWPLRIIVAGMIVGGAVVTAIKPQSGIGVLSVFAVGGALMEFCYERAAAYITAAGVRVVPRLGRKHTYPGPTSPGSARPTSRLRRQGVRSEHVRQRPQTAGNAVYDRSARTTPGSGREDRAGSELGPTPPIPVAM